MQNINSSTKHPLVLLLLLVSSTVLLSACLAEAGKDEEPNDLEDFGWLQSTDMSMLPVNVLLNGLRRTACDEVNKYWSIAHLGDNWSTSGKEDWSVAMLNLDDKSGTVMYDDTDIRLFKGLVSKTSSASGSCVVQRNADESWLAVGGYIIVSDGEYQGTVNLQFQKEDAFESGITSGPIVTVDGCWDVPEDASTSTCLPAPAQP